MLISREAFGVRKSSCALLHATPNASRDIWNLAIIHMLKDGKIDTLVLGYSPLDEKFCKRLQRNLDVQTQDQEINGGTSMTHPRAIKQLNSP